MSLINEALKRADLDRASGGGAGPARQADSVAVPLAGTVELDKTAVNGPVELPCPKSPSVPPPPPPMSPVPQRRPRANWGSLLRVAAVILMFGVLGVIGAWAWQAKQIRQASASNATGSAPRPPSADNAGLAAAPATAATLRSASTPAGVTPPAASQPDSEKAAALLRALLAAADRDPSVNGATARPAAGTALGANPVVRTDATVAPAAPTIQPASGGPPVVANGAATQPEARYTLTGIMRSKGLAIATINGKSLHVGDLIDGAKVLNIGPRFVELEAQGQRITLRI